MLGENVGALHTAQVAQNTAAHAGKHTHQQRQEHIAAQPGPDGHRRTVDGENAQAELPDSFALQAAQALANIKTALAAGGADMGHVLKLTVLIVDHSLERFEHWQSAVRQHWGSGEAGDQRPRFPACTLIPVPKLALPGMLIEVEATAALPMAVGAKAATPA